MNKEAILKHINELKDNAHRLLETAATLEEELAGGSAGSNLPIKKHVSDAIARRRETAFKKNSGRQPRA